MASKTLSYFFPADPTGQSSTTHLIDIPTFTMSLPDIINLVLILILLPPLYLLRRDYKAYLSLGPGGTPATPTGYLRIKILSLFALREPYEPDFVHPHLRPGMLRKEDVPHRPAARPMVAGIAPHRQTTQRAGPELFAALRQALSTLAEQPGNKLVLQTSCFEKHGTGLFSVSPVLATCKGEICHVHPSDGSMHMCLHPGDAKVVLEQGWGERHPLARGGWFTRFVPREFVMIYAPTSVNDIEVLLKIVCAGAWWVGGRECRRREKVCNTETKDGCDWMKSAMTIASSLTSED
jgi:hypothetical protein